MSNLQIKLPIHETFQCTVQGEGYWTGTLVDFIRLAGCPVRCPWCDTGYSNGGKGLPSVPQSIAQLLAQLQSPRVVITGGEPFIHQNLPELVQALLATDKQVSIETSGAYWQDVSPLAWITLSPKQHVNPQYPVQEIFWTRANEIKLVVSTGEEVDFYRKYLAENVNTRVYLQPEWEKHDRAIPIILELLKQHPTYRLSLQTHKFIGVQ
ncbi:MAG: 7-carboxy-7-deazaguanine synthase QueE [Microcoleus sp. PH2017_10_PVI_O_A]|uniref:7-carboxy-7-deazaguanine synthase QueE n=1 Tax=unclassified Microcoleus TaxID=2642155 RepID=UPI001DDC9DB2|nr:MULTISPECIES: 7-carboxy-7-deazaguanine synthase QueE [unclassified Microcoleus]TAE86342.1 MAG: 7-carboxy-7-deazaguanine synthase QueE [Oscillatoriales cyanobacterium]MCC3410041.1 7-carboxy-7-deazaguanine synthase QueE [Microcoleus sp. PH2017_10_PVI_O_A]MCC3464313.1 7-carboxy-7-deazaguanine synthase QueE [Microcoleus sp. PH2017_11_PCY_U_A]MCC3482653.1 7-carboxy-7-deazaguanine synthase QueE [Microcoleus sp. PH2017_12_PCY_D_A]MCC3530869.1 7-carboxy-7-deazaguanine synthase QueE [Microcoleus sp.